MADFDVDGLPIPLSQRVGAGDFVADVRTCRSWQVTHVDRESERVRLAQCADGAEKLVDLADLDRLFFGYPGMGQNTSDATAADVRRVQAAQPLSQRIKPGDVLEGLHGLARGLRVTVVGPSDVGGWIVSDGSRSGHVTPEAVSSWRLVDPAPVPVVSRPAPPGEWQDDALGVKKAARAWLDRRHNAHCPRCYGPAYQGLGALRCERVGGCLADAEPKVDAIDASADLRGAAPDADVWEMSGRENYWLADGCDGRYATRELAVAAWREVVIAKAKREAGL